MSQIVDITSKLNGSVEEKKLSIDEFKNIVLADYRIVQESRQASLTGRKEVLTGKAKFGIFGDGKELAQIAMAKAFKKGDWRSGYYRDQTFMMATGQLNLEEFFAQLYANPDVALEPHSAGRQMNAHFATRLVNKDGSWKNQKEQYNTSADMSPTAGQMPRLLGLAYASKVYRNDKNLAGKTEFSVNGNEVAFGTIGDASTSEGLFWETMNAATVLQVPLAMSVWDDGYGISVEKKYQTTKQSISAALRGFERDEDNDGLLIYNVRGWDYAALCEAYEKGVAICREQHIPVLFHVEELTQPQGHSTSGSHERYKSKDRLAFEQEYDCIAQFKKWITENAIASIDELDAIENQAKEAVKQARRKAWDDFLGPIKKQVAEAAALLSDIANSTEHKATIESIKTNLVALPDPARHNVIQALKKALQAVRTESNPAIDKAKGYLKNRTEEGAALYNTFIHSDSPLSPLKLKAIKPEYAEDAKLVDGREVLRDNYDKILGTIPEFLIFGEDAGKIGGVNQTLEGMQAKYGEQRVGDTGIREATIVGQAIGMALRGLRPVAEIQYLDYLLYAVQTLSDDLASLSYRTAGGQRAPMIISTRGHRLEGIWHSGSPMGMIINSLRGIHICVPRNMTQAAGFYNTLLAGDEPGVIIEPLNGYRIKELLPSNLGEFRTPLGEPEVLVEGTDVTLVTYGSCIRVAQEGISHLKALGISVELIDAQTLLPFDLTGTIVKSVQKTNRVVFMDEDVPGGATAFMLQQVIEIQGGYQYLDSTPVTLSAKAHRPSFGSDGDYFSKPAAEDVFDTIYNMMCEAKPAQYKPLY
jgi:pyruvate/2-oxoglutarate/acetoin dehydrogenase E1 component/TPP-dependent pyruvate/acetoin dehydrogenase alpha subunit